MKIYLSENCREISSYQETYKPNEKGEVKIETIANLFKTTPDKTLEIIKNSPDFYVTESSNDGNQNSKKDGK